MSEETKAIIHFNDKTVRVITVYTPPPDSFLITPLEGDDPIMVELSGITKKEYPVYREKGYAKELIAQEKLNEFALNLGRALGVLQKSNEVKSFLKYRLGDDIYREAEAALIVIVDAFFDDESDS